MKLNNTFEITDTTQSTSKDTGALVLEGGVGIERNLNVGGDLGVSGNANIGDDASDTHTFNGTVNFTHLVNLNGGIDVDNIDIGGTGTENTITTDTGDLVLDSNSGTTQVNDNLSVNGNISGNRLDIDLSLIHI